MIIIIMKIIIIDHRVYHLGVGGFSNGRGDYIHIHLHRNTSKLISHHSACVRVQLGQQENRWPYSVRLLPKNLPQKRKNRSC